jgi:hypothetical protein
MISFTSMMLFTSEKSFLLFRLTNLPPPKNHMIQFVQEEINKQQTTLPHETKRFQICVASFLETWYINFSHATGFIL